jgi:hypothetical protein
MNALRRAATVILAGGAGCFPVAGSGQSAGVAQVAHMRQPDGGVVLGFIRDSLGSPLRDVRVKISGVTAEWRSRADCRFVADGIPPGTHVVEATALGFAPERRIVDLAADDSSRVDLWMAALITKLSPMMIEERAHYNARKDEVDQRRRAGFGYRTDSIELTHLPGVWDAFNFPGVHVGVRSPSRWAISMTGVYSIASRGGIGMSMTCSPTIWIDGEISDIEMLNLLHKEEIALIEVYNSAARAPLQYGGSRTNCGIVLVWRKQYINPPGARQ